MIKTFKRHPRSFALLVITLIGISLLSIGLTSSSAQQSGPLTFQISIVDATGAAKSSFYLGEPVALKFSVTNVSATPQTIISLDQAPISLTLSAKLTGQDGTVVSQAQRGGKFEVRNVGGREATVFTPPTDTTIAPGQTVQVLISDLGNAFGIRMDEGSYVLSATYSPILQAQASFNVAIVEAQSVPVLQQLAANGDASTQRWANSYLDQIQKLSISGRITDSNGAPVGGVRLTITGAPVTNSGNLSDGTYSLMRLSTGGNYTITPSLQGYTFEPASLAFKNLTTKQVNANFTATKGAAGDSATLDSSGATVTASSTFDVDYRADGAINGSTHGDWGTGSGGWQDGTLNTFPDWIEVNFGASKAIDWINIYTLQDNFQNSTEPMPTETFTLYGIVDFDVQYWNGSAWVTVPGGEVNGNNKVWRKFSFPTVTTSKIRVNVRNALGGYSRITEIEAFHVNKPPTVSIPGTLQGAPGTAIQFSSTVTDDGAISSYEWDFGDNATGTGPNPTHTYAAAGTYTVTLTVTDDGGEKATATKTVTVSGPPQPPVANPGGSYTGFPGTSIIFDGRGSSDPDGHIVSYLWDFGDGTTAPGAAPSHTYAQAGTYTARLTVTDNSGSTATATATATIATSQPPPSNLLGVTNCQVHLHWVDNSSDETGFIVERSTDNGQNYSTVQTLPANSTQALNLPRPDHTQGSFIYRVRATNAQGVSAPSNTYVAEPLCQGCSCDSTTPNFAPDVKMTSPATGTTVGAGSTVVLVAQVSATNALSSVKFYQGTTFIGDGALVNPSTNPPSYVFSWQNVSAGNYSLTAKATDTGGLIGTSTAVSLNVLAPPTVSITSPANNARFAPPGTIAINANASATNATISKVEFFEGMNKIGEDTSAPYSFTWNSVASGAYQLTAKATDSNQLSATSTLVAVIVNSLPVVTLTSPTAGQVFAAPGQITVSADASETNGTITKVDFYRGPTLIGTDTTAPYTVTWSNVAAGSYLINAIATDSFNVIASSGSVNINVGNPPTVSITSPANEALLPPGINTISATAATPNGGITKVEFFAGNTKIGEDTTAPFSIQWANSTSGRYQLTAKATDAIGLTVTSAPISVLVGLPPTVSLTAPTNGQVFTVVPATVSLSATASDTDGTITQVDFFQGTTLIGTDTTSPYTYTWNGVASGTYSITARATDNAGLMTTTSPNTIIVGSPPSISITSPVNRAMLSPGSNIVINANASDADGTISQVEFYQGTSLIGTDSTSPYSITLSNVASGPYVLTAKATDNNGFVTTSAPIAITTPVFFDDFNDNSLNAVKWSLFAPSSPAVVSEQGQQLQIALPGSTATYNGVNSNATYDMRGATVQVELSQPVSQAGWAENRLQLEKDAQNSLMINVGAGSILFRSTVNGAQDQAVIPYDFTAHRHWRIRHDIGSNSVSFETSPDAVTWTTRKTATAGFSLAAMRFQMIAGAWGTGNAAPGAAIYNDFQYMADATAILSDNFNDNSIDTSKWTTNLFSGFTDNSLPLNETAQRLEIGPLLLNTSGSHYRGLVSVNVYDFTDGAAYVELVQPASSTTQGDAMFTIGLNVDNYYRIYVSGGQLIGLKKIAGTKTTLFSINYDAVNHRFLRIRHQAGSMIMETAPANGSAPGTWTQQYSQMWSSSVVLTSTVFEVKGGTWQAEANAAGTVIFDNFVFKRNGQDPPAPPTLSSVSPISGPTAGGTVLTLTGTQFVTGATVSVGGVAATSVNVASSTSITATAPAHAAGAVNVVVTNPDGQSATLNNAYTYIAPPTLSSVSPTSGPIAGGTVLTLTGTQFVTGATVSVGGVAATSVNVASSTSITATAPAHTAGAVSVVVTNPDGQSVTLNNAYTYTLPANVLLEDDFNDNSINTSKWTTTVFSGFTDNSLPVNETSQRFEIGPLLLNTADSHYRGLASVSTFNFTGGAAYVELVQAPSSTTNADAMFTIGPDVNNYYRIYVSGGQLIGQRKIAGTKTTLFSINYDPVNHRFLRIRHQAGSMIMETAPSNGSAPGTWTQQYSQIWSSSVVLTSVLFEVKGGTWQAEANAAGKVIFDNFLATN